MGITHGADVGCDLPQVIRGDYGEKVVLDLTVKPATMDGERPVNFEIISSLQLYGIPLGLAFCVRVFGEIRDFPTAVAAINRRRAIAEHQSAEEREVVLNRRLGAVHAAGMTVRDVALELARRLVAAGHQALLAGGCVRDRLLAREPKDFDIATSARPEQVLQLFPGANEVGAHFGVVIAKLHGHYVEIATFRTDGSYKDGRRPEMVTFATPEEDAQRRDFTVNGLFERPESGEVIDHVGGLADLRAGLLRAIGEPEARFKEDGLRLLRAVRFSAVLGFEIEPLTLAAIRRCAPLLGRISLERVRDEFSKILTSPRRRAGVELLVETGLMAHIVPEFLATLGCEQPPEWHPEGDVYTHTCIMLEMLEADASLELCLAVLLHDIAKPPCQTFDDRIRFNGHDAMGAEMADTILRRLRFPNDVIAAVVPMVARHMQFMNVKQMRTAKLKRFMAEPTFPEEMELHRVDCGSSNGFTDNHEFLQAKAEEFAAEPLIPPPLVTGRDLITHGLQPGPRFRQILEAIQTEQLEGRILDRERALIYLKELAAETSA